ncbi:MAG TPA: hypothetical protein VFO54_00930, partial [Chryseosolibacter sp.]|nr:hypothetical protein [Chryseosolibacter sp.]
RPVLLTFDPYYFFTVSKPSDHSKDREPTKTRIDPFLTEMGNDRFPRKRLFSPQWKRPNQ